MLRRERPFRQEQQCHANLLWGNFLLQGGKLVFFGLRAGIELACMGAIFAAPYSMWETGMHQGNCMLLAVFSYFTPAASMLFASFWLGPLSPAGF